MQRALLTALVLAASCIASCKKEPPKGDLPPAADWQGGSAHGTTAAPPPASPPAGMANPHGSGDDPHAGMANPNPHGGAVPEQTPPRTLEKLADGKFGLGPFSLTAPADWTIKPITSSMRAADFVLPAKPGAEAELIVYYFGDQGAGSVQDNLDRWIDQFEQPGGKPSREVAKIEKTKFGGQDATFVSLNGKFVAQAMPGAAAPVNKDDQALLAAIVASPSGPYYFKLVGAKPTVDGNAKAFRAMLDSLKVR